MIVCDGFDMRMIGPGVNLTIESYTTKDVIELIKYDTDTVESFVKNKEMAELFSSLLDRDIQVHHSNSEPVFASDGDIVSIIFGRSTDGEHVEWFMATITNIIDSDPVPYNG